MEIERIKGNFFVGAVVGALGVMGALIIYELWDEPVFILAVGVLIGVVTYEQILKIKERRQG